MWIGNEKAEGKEEIGRRRGSRKMELPTEMRKEWERVTERSW